MAAITYAQNGTFAAAAREVQVEPSTVRKWSKDVRFMALVNHQLELLAQESLVSDLMLERMALDVYDIAMAEEDTHGVDKEGSGFSAPVTNLPAANQAIATIHRIKHDRQTRKIDAAKSKSGQTVIVNIENANFNSNQHFEMLKNKNSVDVDTIEDAKYGE